MIRRTSLLFAFLCLVLAGKAQERDIDAEWEAYKRKIDNTIEDYRAAINKKYAEYLKSVWEKFPVSAPVEPPKEKDVPPVMIEQKPIPAIDKKKKPFEEGNLVIEKGEKPVKEGQKPIKEDPKSEKVPIKGDKKPEIIPIKEEEKVTVENNQILIEEIEVPAPEPQPTPVAPIREMPSPIDATNLKVKLYGTEFGVRADDKLKFRINSIKEADISQAWEGLASDDYNNLIRDCLTHRVTRNLSDWAYLQMLDQICDEFLGKDTNESELLKAYIYAQSGYQMKLAIINGKLKMLFGSKHQIYKMPYLIFGDVFFYLGNEAPTIIQMCGASFPGEKPMSLYVSQLPQLEENRAEERIIQSNNTPWMTASAREDKNLMAYLEDYPVSQLGKDKMTRWAMYAQTPLSELAKSTLYPHLRDMIDGKTPAEAVDVLCHWIQTGFVYGYDDKIWGGDRAFFADETLYYPYCDCEDRSILLTRLVRDLLGLKCALIYYPGHLATAIAVGENVKGDHIRINDEKFIICDPTYINAPIGRTMPGMDNSTAKAIVL